MKQPPNHRPYIASLGTSRVLDVFIDGILNVRCEACDSACQFASGRRGGVMWMWMADRRKMVWSEMSKSGPAQAWHDFSCQCGGLFIEEPSRAFLSGKGPRGRTHA